MGFGHDAEEEEGEPIADIVYWCQSVTERS